jgi:hypothetical protein
MRLTIVLAIVVGTASLFAGYFTADDSLKPLSELGRKCEQMGFKRGTSEFAYCRFELAHQTNPRGTTPITTD